MSERIIEIDTEFIKLGQLLKLADVADSGSEAKQFILEGSVFYNGELCLLRGKKVYHNDIITVFEEDIKVVGNTNNL